ncbi:MarR family winged helix-turn-helix transcriptional regulator [Clostridium chauvoei]|uniref:MarR family transcriptional regulator n=2 Tax=Clostridium chauvoei TaxID=46867 RepID=A0ABD4RK27_9CLOT|nr:MarR family transcriptional regulator [Clostridium chauvoei]ATD55541.1 MarR family transcriptional regulator [Clostridium chauvoei]ATD56783.1 MarR family transcriptional regulator [Clostridium chauvoei]MBX7281229.1 MarR family transcriptional regulator [Clostridium chauvoei]MBX7283711.1 MarR family transcriptional regulator [Clostridium chauvoei]MBX7286319.1 MarR family transcriptional regulator [Clostridium chauvoei]
MDTIDLTKISDSLFKMLFQLNKKVFNQDEIIKRIPMPPSHVKVIFHLIHTGPSSVSQIAQNLCISKPNMTPIIDKLISEDLVTRYEDPKDRRIIRIELTKKATILFEEHKQRIKDMLLKKISNLCEEDLLILESSINNLTNIVSKLD